MPLAPEKSDQPLLELLRQTGGLSIQELMERLAVTATAVRQRLDRLCAAGLVAKEEIRAANRGRPSHRYCLSEAGLRTLDRNMVELAKVVWDEIQAIDDQAVRNYLLGRISRRLAAEYGNSPATHAGANSAGQSSSNGKAGRATGPLDSPAADRHSPAADRHSPAADRHSPAADRDAELTARLERLAETLRERQFPVVVQQDPATMLPILKINGCPFPELSGKSHDICAVEEAMFSQLLGDPVKLRYCRCDSPDGGCVFDVVNASAVAVANPLPQRHSQPILSESSNESLPSGISAS